MDVNRQIGIAPADLATGKIGKPPFYPVGEFRQAAVRSAILDAILSRQLWAELTHRVLNFSHCASESTALEGGADEDRKGATQGRGGR